MAFKLGNIVKEALQKGSSNQTGYKQGNNPFKLSGIDPKGAMDKFRQNLMTKHGKSNQQSPKGEWLAGWNQKTNKEARKSTDTTTITSGQEIRGLEHVPTKQEKSEENSDLGHKWSPITKKFESTFDPSNISLETSEIEFNPEDLRLQSGQDDPESNFGITEGMSFGEAFQQAGKKGAKEGDIFKWDGDKSLYEFKNK